MAVTGIDVFLLFLGEAIPPLRDHVSIERDMENLQGISVNKLRYHAHYYTVLGFALLL